MDKTRNFEAAKEWHRYANMDLVSANHLLTLHPVPFEIIAYLCQQCGEKYLKSYLIYNDQDVIKTHDLTLLMNLCVEFNESFAALETQCKTLLRYITDTRYPSRLELTDQDIQVALEYAAEIKDFVLKIIDEDR
jgi:HEPN domain-containing protein